MWLQVGIGSQGWIWYVDKKIFSMLNLGDYHSKLKD